NAESVKEAYKPFEAVRDLVFYLPLGMLGNPSKPQTCPWTLVELGPGASGCPPASTIGTVLPFIFSNMVANRPDPSSVYPIFNVEPEPGYAAEFAFASQGYVFNMYVNVVLHDGQYMVRVAVPGIPAIAQLTGLIASFQGALKERIELPFEAPITVDRG